MDAFNSIELILKTPNQMIDDIQLKCNEEWTVKMLKDHLQNVYPSKPLSSSQRLIYLGKLLQDHVILKEVFSGLGVKTLHIVCSDMQSTSTGSSSSATITTDNTDGLRFRGINSVPQSQLSSNPTQQYGGLSNNHGNMNQQQYQQLWNQQYQRQLQQYYMHMQQWQQAMASGQIPSYQNYTSMQSTINPFVLPHTPPATPNTPSTPGTPGPIPPNDDIRHQPQPGIDDANQEQQEPQPQQPGNNQQNNNMGAMNAGPGGAIMQADNGDNGNAGNRDWLDVLYMSMRALMLLSIVYFYSSTTRFIMVTILGFIVYLYQGGWFTPRRVQEPTPDVRPAAEDNRDEVDNGNDSNTNKNENNEDNNTSEGGQNSPSSQEQTVPESPPPLPPRPNAFKIFCTFVVSFVTSLFPTAPPPLHQN